jgi:3-oxoacyl-[acyl-carrier protein] reductase
MGRAIAIALAQGGADVLINYRDDAAAAQSAVDAIVEAGRRAHVVQANVGKSAEVDRLVAACVSELGPPTILVNNAGIGKRVLDVADLDIDTWNDTIAINLTAPFLMTQAVVPYMRTAGWGRIINISSTAAQTGGSVGPHYAASKAGIIGLTHGYASKLVKEGITVNAIAMAQIETDMLRSATAADPSRIPIGRFGTVDEVAAVATMLVDNAYMTGQTISLNGGMYYTS